MDKIELEEYEFIEYRGHKIYKIDHYFYVPGTSKFCSAWAAMVYIDEYLMP